MKNSKVSALDMLYEKPGPKAALRIRIAAIISLILIILLAAAVVYRFYRCGQLDKRYWSFFFRWSTWKFLCKGLFGTVRAALMAGLMAALAGFLLMLLRISKNKILNIAGTVLVEFTRGVPTLLFIYFFFLVVPQFKIALPAFWKISMPVAISASGVVAEVLRSGVNAVPKGQSEAALSLGMSPWNTFFKVVFPQALSYVVPAMIAELVIVVKDTTFAYVVNYQDLMLNSKVLISNYDALLSVYLVAAVIYILINYLLNRLSEAAAKRRRPAA